MNARKEKEAPSASTVRRDLIQWFYDLNAKGGAPKKISDVCSGIKSDYGYLGPLVKQHLTYLVDLKFISKETVMTTVKTGTTTRDQPKTTYRIGAKGIEYVEGKSEFSDRERYPGINISATGGSSIVLGDGNVVNSQYREVYEELGRLETAIADSTELNDTDKLEASVSVETIKDQLALPVPDKSIVEKAWDKASKICTVASLAELAAKVGPMIHSIFS